ncbi:defensin-B5-like [Mauremys mutica]|uniref:defensin-B5-like n=1 Tax=Mauremys mutica TaxID=74926 RepID=UPI001D164F62|nr:defensin-B5-like [Mauremys mutica]
MKRPVVLIWWLCPESRSLSVYSGVAEDHPFCSPPVSLFIQLGRHCTASRGPLTLQQEQARSEEQDEPQEPAWLDQIEGARVVRETRSSCFAHGGQCRFGFCDWKETKIASCSFARPCCKKVI